MATLSPFTQPVPVHPHPPVELSPQLTGASEPTIYSLHYTYPSPLSPLYKADDDADGSERLDADSFTLYAPTSQHHLVPLSPTSASSLSPIHSLSCGSSVSSLSSPSPPPCSTCPSCCGQVQRLSLLVPALRKKAVHTASLVSLYQATRAHLTAVEQQLVESKKERDEARRLVEAGESRGRQLREEAERREVRLRAQESHITQLKASHAKLSSEKVERDTREQSAKEAQRELDALQRRGDKLRDSIAQLQLKREEEERKLKAVRAQKEQDEVEWLVDAPSEATPIIIDLPSAALPTPSLHHPAAPDPQPAAVGGANAEIAESASGAEVVDISTTLRLVGEAMKKLRADLRAKSTVIRQLRAEKKQWRKTHGDADANRAKGEEMDVREKVVMKRRKLSRGQVMEAGATVDDIESFAAEVMRAMEAKEPQERMEDDHKGAVEQCNEEKQEEVAPSSSRDVIRVVRADLVMATAVTGCASSASDTTAVLAQPVKRKRGRPRIHPIKLKTAGGPQRRGRPRKNLPKPPSQPSEPAATLLPTPLPSPTLPQHILPDASPPTAGPTPAVDESSAFDAAPRPGQSLPHRPLQTPLEQLTTLLHVACSALAPLPSTQCSTPAATDAGQVLDVVSRCGPLLRPCPCSCSAAPRSSPTQPPATTSAAPLALPLASLAFLAFPHPRTVSTVDEKCSCCSSPAAPLLTTNSPHSHSEELVHWDDAIDVIISLLTAPQSKRELHHAVCDLLIGLDQQLTSRWKAQSTTASQSESCGCSSSLLIHFCRRACTALLSSPCPSSSSPHFSLLLTVLRLAGRCEQMTSIVRALLVHSVTSSQPSLPLLERAATLCPAAFAVSPSPTSPTHHVKALRLITASCLLSLSPASTQLSTSSTTASPSFPSLTSLVFTELLSMSSASQHFVISRFVSELLLHSTVPAFHSQAHLLAAASSITAAFHILFLFLSFPIVYSIVRQHVLPTISRCKAPLHTAILLLILPSAFHSALTFLSSSPTPDKADLASTRHAVTTLLQWTTAVVGSDGDALVRAAACDVLLRVMGGIAQVQGLLLKKAEKDEVWRVQRLWLRSVTVREAEQMEAEGDDTLNGWLLLHSVRREVRPMREEGRSAGEA